MQLIAPMCLVLMLSSCATAPVRTGLANFSDLPLPITHGLRIGVEYLPPANHPPGIFEAKDLIGDQTADSDAPIHRMSVGSAPDYGPPRPTEESLSRYDELQENWELHTEQIRRKKDIVERVALRFLSELIDDDRKRVERALGSSLIGSQGRPASDPLANYLDEADREGHLRQMTENGPKMLRRPARNALKELPWLRDVEVALHSFKETPIVPIQRRSKSRLSLRLRASHFDDPVELRWIRSGFSLASSADHGKIGYTKRITSRLSVRLRSKYDYEDSDWRLFGNLVYKLNSQTNVHALVGNRINILSGAGTYPGGPKHDADDPKSDHDEDGKTRGLLIYVEHLF